MVGRFWPYLLGPLTAGYVSAHVVPFDGKPDFGSKVDCPLMASCVQLYFVLPFVGRLFRPWDLPFVGRLFRPCKLPFDGRLFLPILCPFLWACD